MGHNAVGRNRMKIFLKLFPLLIMTAVTTAVAAPKNIVLILADDLGWADTTISGETSLFETPNIERLAVREKRGGQPK